jgi:hypothetical protein
MDELELRLILGEHDIDVPDRCISCVRLGGLATQLSQAHEANNSMIAYTDEQVFAGMMRPHLTSKAQADYPWASEEQIKHLVDEHMARFFKADDFADMLKNMGALMTDKDNTIDSTVAEIKTLLAECPPEGHSER